MPEPRSNIKNKKSPSVLISGASGLVGRYLISTLLSEGYEVSCLSRTSLCNGKVKTFFWDPSKGIIDHAAFEGIDSIVHLSGANLADKRWTTSRKNEIIASRVDSAKLLFKTVREHNIKLNAFVSASAVGYYGALTSDRIFSEEDPPSDDFLSTTCRLWEEAADLFAGIGIRTVKIRTGIVLERSEGAFSRLLKPAKYGLIVRPGSGKQYFPWIHIEDLCGIYLKALTDRNMNSAYNAVAPEDINYNDFVRSMARLMRRPLILLPVPGWVLKAALGEMSDIVLRGSRISAEKITDSGYSFRFKRVDEALKNILAD